jgi:hypothetical protein
MRLAAYLLTGLAAGFGAVLWLGVPELHALSVGHVVAAIGSAAVGTLTAAIGGLMVSDWQADVQSRHDWAQAGLTRTELSTSLDVRPAWDMDASYQSSSVNTALQATFRAHRCSQPVQCEGVLVAIPKTAGAPLNRDHVGRTGDLSRGAARRLALKRPIFRNIGRMTRSHQGARLHVKRLAPSPYRVANNASWQQWGTHGVTTTPRLVLSAGRADEIAKLNSSENGERARPAEVGLTDLAGEAPSCRGPPSRRSRMPRHKAAMPQQPPVRRSSANPAQGTDPIVRDDLGQPVPVCAAEVNVIEAYLGHLLSDVFESSIADEEGA